MTTPFPDLHAVAAFYAALHAEHGDAPEAVGWNGPHTQMVSFIQMAAIDGLASGREGDVSRAATDAQSGGATDAHGRRARPSVLDVGCGLGDFAGFLRGRGIDVDYTGWDICAPLVDRAQKLHPDARFEVRDLLADPPDPYVRFDFVVSSGALSMRLPDHSRWAADMIRAMYGLCRRGLVVTMLSERYARDEPFAEAERYFYADPAAALSLCLSLSAQVTLDHASLAHAFAVYVYRDNTAPIERLARHIAPGRGYGPGHRAVVEHYGTFDMHEQMIEYLETLEPTAEVLDTIGLAAFRLGDQMRQLAAFEGAVAAAGEGDAARIYLMHLGIAYLDAGRSADAVPVLEQARALSPEDVRVAHMLGVACERAGLAAKAREAYRAALALSPDHDVSARGLERVRSPDDAD